jgi:3-oxoacyl-(acyl-carrier-protein) synthase
VGAVSPFGWGTAALWRGLASGSTAIRPVELFDAAPHRTTLAGGVPEPEDDPLAWAELRPAERARLSRTDVFALAAAHEALGNAGLVRAHGLGVFLGSSTGGMWEGERFHAAHHAGVARPPVAQLAAQQQNAPGDAVARAFGATGPVETISAACSASSMALGAALDAIERGEVDVALAGGADGLCELTYSGFNSLRAVADGPSRPYRADRAGLSIGEGGGVLVLESAEHAAARGATPRALLAGAAASCDAHHPTAPHPEGRGIAAAMRLALERAGLAPEDVDVVNVHGTGTPQKRSLPLVATKGALGHLLGACGALEAVATVESLARGELPPAPGGGEVDPALGGDLVLDEVRRPERCTVALSINLAFGGANAAVVLRAPEAGS